MHGEMLRYLLSGIAAFIADMAVLFLCTDALGMHYLLANLFGYFTGFTVAFILNTRWVFRYRRFAGNWREVVIFNVIVITGLGISEASMALLVELAQWHYLWAKVLSAFLVMVFNFACKKYFLFSPAPDESGVGD